MNGFLQDGLRWLTVPQAAKHFGRSDSIILRWCHSGFMLEVADVRIRRDLTGHWLIGIPSSEVHCQNTAIPVIPSHLD